MKVVLFILTICILCTGCKLIEDSLTNINNWDLSACYDGFSICWELFSDNSDKILGGFDGNLLSQ